MEAMECVMLAGSETGEEREAEERRSARCREEKQEKDALEEAQEGETRKKVRIRTLQKEMMRS